MKGVFLAGRIIFGGFFLYNGINHFREHEHLTNYAAAKDVPLPEAGVLASGVLLAAAGASIVSGALPKWGTLGIVGFLALASPLMHDFWNAEDPQQQQNDMIHFSKNMALLGAALLMTGIKEPWPASIPCCKS